MQNGRPTIDLEEIYIAVLKRNCRIELVPNPLWPAWDVWQLVEIFEDNGISYKVRLYASD